MKRKEVEDVMGGKDAWANVDKTDGWFLRANNLFVNIESNHSFQRNAHATNAMGARHFSIRFKFEVRTNR